MGRSPVSSMNLASPPRPTDVKTQGGPSTPLGQQAPSSCSECSISSSVKSGRHKCRCSAANAAAATPSSFSSSSSESAQNLSEENTTDAITGTRKRKRKKKREWVQPAGTRERRRLQSLERPRYCRTRSAKTTTKQAEPSIPQKGKRSTAKTGEEYRSLPWFVLQFCHLKKCLKLLMLIEGIQHCYDFFFCGLSLEDVI